MGDEINDSPIEQVRLTIPITDDCSLEALTFRTCVLGGLSCILQAMLSAFSSFRQNPLSIPIICVQIAILPVGKLMERMLPKKFVRVPGTKWIISMNPGPFNQKEHALISVFANTGNILPQAVEIIIVLKTYYHKKINLMVAMMIALSTQLLGYGFAGLFMKFLVDSPYMWWPSTLVDVTLYRTLHETEKRPRGLLTRLQFFTVAFVSSFAYYIVPGYLFPSISALSFVCWIWKDSVIAHQLGAGRNGLGIGSFGLDWQTITGYTSDPLVTPPFAINNIMIGFIIAFYIITPIAYWTNSFEAKRFPIFSSNTFDIHGQRYNVSNVIKEESFTFDENGYNSYSKMYMSIFRVYSYGLKFASITAALVHVALHHGKDIWQQFKEAYGDQTSGDVHSRLMKKYEPIPKWWFYAILVSMFSLAIFSCQRGLGENTELPFWVIAVGCVVGLLLVLPNAIICATTGWYLPISFIADLIIGYLNPGRPFACMIFGNYATESMNHAVNCLSVLKFGHYMKIPPKSMFIVLVIGSAISVCVNLGTSWFLITRVDNICNPAMLPKGSPWTCLSNELFYNVSNMWGLIGPSRLFAPHGIYSRLYYFFLFGAVATLISWKLSQKFPEKKWIKLIHIPLILTATSTTPPGGAVNFWSWYIVGLISNFVFKNFKGWWARYNYVLSAALAAGASFMAVVMYFALNMKDIYGPNWWGLQVDDHCPLARCPTAPGIVVHGCPVFN